VNRANVGNLCLWPDQIFFAKPMDLPYLPWFEHGHTNGSPSDIGELGVHNNYAGFS